MEEQVREITECCICVEEYTDPRILSCIHTFCLKCLETTALKSKSKPGDIMPCPICRTPFVIPTEGMAGLQKNFFMERLMEISKLSAPQSSAIFCDICKSDSEEEAKEVPLAVQYCVHCHQNICERCCRDHKRFKDLQNHQLVQIGSQLTDELIKKASLEFCELHGKQEANLYCVDCAKVICMMCFVQKHKSHDCSDIEEVAEKFRNRIKCDMGRISHCTEEITAKLCQIDTSLINFEEKVDGIEKDIIQRGAALKELVDKCTRSLLDELALVRQQVSKKNKCKREASETHKMVIKSFETYCMELTSKGSSAEICRAASDVHLRAEELEKEHQKRILEEISSVKFDKSLLEEFLKKENIIGNIRATLCPTIQLIGKLDINNSDIRGVAKLENKIYVLCNEPVTLLVFDGENPFHSQKNIYIDGIRVPRNIGSCEKWKCLYVTDTRSRCIWKIAADDHRLTKWLTEVDDGPVILSVTSEGHVLVPRKGQQSYVLDIYGFDAKIIHVLSLPASIRYPLQIIQKQNKEFIISHTATSSSTEPGAISRVTSDGKTVICGITTEGVSPDLRGICYLAFDSENNQVFATNHSDRRVTVFDSDSLELIKVLLQPEENSRRIGYRKRLVYDVKKKQLIVSHRNGQVFIYEVN